MAIGPSPSTASRRPNDPERRLLSKIYGRYSSGDPTIPPPKKYYPKPRSIAASPVSKTSALNNLTTTPLCTKVTPIINHAIQICSKNKAEDYASIAHQFLYLAYDVNLYARRTKLTDSITNCIKQFPSLFATLWTTEQKRLEVLSEEIPRIAQAITDALQKQKTHNTAELNQNLEDQVNAELNKNLEDHDTAELNKNLENQVTALNQKIEKQRAALATENEGLDDGIPTVMGQFDDDD